MIDDGCIGTCVFCLTTSNRNRHITTIIIDEVSQCNSFFTSSITFREACRRLCKFSAIDVHNNDDDNNDKHNNILSLGNLRK